MIAPDKIKHPRGGPDLPTEVFADPGRNGWYFREEQHDSVARYIREDVDPAREANATYVAGLESAALALLTEADRTGLALSRLGIGATALGLKSRALRAALSARPTTAPDTRVVTDAERDVIAERQRQISAENWTPEHDDTHSRGGMAVAAACYALSSAGWSRTAIWEIWPKAWGVNWFKPTYTAPRRDLVKAGALIIAEIERLDRATDYPENRGEP